MPVWEASIAGGGFICNVTVLVLKKYLLKGERQKRGREIEKDKWEG